MYVCVCVCPHSLTHSLTHSPSAGGFKGFYLAYHGLVDVELKRKLAQVYARMAPSLLYIAPVCVRACVLI